MILDSRLIFTGIYDSPSHPKKATCKGVRPFAFFQFQVTTHPTSHHMQSDFFSHSEHLISTYSSGHLTICTFCSVVAHTRTRGFTLFSSLLLLLLISSHSTSQLCLVRSRASILVFGKVSIAARQHCLPHCLPITYSTP